MEKQLSVARCRDVGRMLRKLLLISAAFGFGERRGFLARGVGQSTGRAASLGISKNVWRRHLTLKAISNE